MKTASVNELKQELTGATATKLLELCLRLARFKKENKELLDYLVFESHDEASYIGAVNDEMSSLFMDVRKQSGKYYALPTNISVSPVRNRRKQNCCCIFAFC
jgi:hypothetical protein